MLKCWGAEVGVHVEEQHVSMYSLLTGKDVGPDGYRDCLLVVGKQSKGVDFFAL